MGGRALLKGLWRGGKLQGSLAHHGYSFVSCRAMSSRLFVGGLSFTTEEEGLRTAFSKFGEVVDARIVTDRESGRSRGFGFVTFLAEADADTAKDKLNGQFLDGRVIRVDRASPRPAPPPPPPRLSMPGPSSEEQTTSQDWGSIPSPIAAVPQNAGLVQATGAGAAVPSSDLPSLNSLASSQANTPPSYSVPPPSPPLPPEPPRPSFSFNLDLSKPDPNFVPRHRPPRLRPSMMDYEFGLFSDTSKFPYNTNFGTGFLKVRGPEAEFDFSDIKEAAAKKKAEEAAAKHAQEAEAAAKEAEEARDKQAQEVEGVVPQEVAAATMVSGPEAKEAEGAASKHAEEAAVNQSQSAAAATLESRDASQNTLQAEEAEEAKDKQAAEAAAKEAEEARDKQAQEVEGVVANQPQEVAAATMVSGPEAKEAEGAAAKHAEEAAVNQSQSAAATTLESRDASQNTLQADATAQVHSGSQIASQEPSPAASSDSSPLSTAEASQSELRQVGL